MFEIPRLCPAYNVLSAASHEWNFCPVHTHTHYDGEYESVCMQVLECVCVRIAISALQSVETEIASDNRFDFSSVFMQISE